MAVRRTADISDYMRNDDDEEDTRTRYDEDDEDTPPSRRKRRDDEARPRKTRRSRSEDEEDDDSRRSRSRYDDDDDEEDEDPDVEVDRSSIVQRGWKAAKKAMAESSEYTDEFKFDDDPQVVKFLDGSPMAFRQHWLDQKQGKKSYVCVGRDCPLCEILGDAPSARYAFPIVNLSVDGMPAQLLVTGARLTGQLEKHHNSDRTGPLEKGYWALSRSGKKQQTTYSVEPVKPRDLDEDWEIDEEEVLEVLKNTKEIGPEAISVTSRQELRKIARELSEY